MIWKLQLLSHNLAFLFRPVSLGNYTSIPIVKHAPLELGISLQSPWVFLVFSATDYLTIPNPSFSRVLLPYLGWCLKIHSLSSRQSPIENLCLISNLSFTNYLQPPSHRRLVVDLPILTGTSMKIVLRRSGTFFLFL